MSQARTYDDRDGSVLTYSGAWFRDGTWSAASGESGTLAGTNDLSAYVTFTFPVAATSFTYYGMMRSRGGQYAVCIDCDPTSGSASFSSVNGFDASDNGANEPAALFSTSFLQPGIHSITMRNQADPRGTPAGNSQLTLDRVVLQIPGVTTTTSVVITPTRKTSVAPVVSPTTSPSTTPTPPVAPPTTSSTTSPPTSPPTTTGNISSPQTGPTSSLNTSLIGASTTDSPVITSNVQTGATGLPDSTLPLSTSATPTSGVAASTTPSDSSKSHPPNVGGIVGSIIGSLVCIACILLVVFWLRVRRRNSSSHIALPPTPNAQSSSSLIHPDSGPDTLPRESTTTSPSSTAMTQATQFSVTSSVDLNSTSVSTALDSATTRSSSPTAMTQVTPFSVMSCLDLNSTPVSTVSDMATVSDAVPNTTSRRRGYSMVKGDSHHRRPATAHSFSPSLASSSTYQHTSPPSAYYPPSERDGGPLLESDEPPPPHYSQIYAT